MDKKQIEEIYQKNVTTIYKYLCTLTHDPVLSEDLTQETFYQAIRGIDKFRGDCKVSVWLCQIAKRLWYKELNRKNRYVTEEINDAIPSGENVEQSYLQNAEKVEIFRLMQHLDELTREVMYLRLAGDLQFAEIADIMGKTESWARVTYYRGKQKLMKGREKWKEN